MNTPVSFELAKLLKEKGFKSESKAFYDGSGELLHYNHSNNVMQRFRYEAPTISEVVMWLYEKHGIWIGVICDVGNDLLFTFKIYSTNIGEERCIVNGNMYESPTEDYEAAIEYTLKNLL